MEITFTHTPDGKLLHEERIELKEEDSKEHWLCWADIHVSDEGAAIVSMGSKLVTIVKSGYKDYLMFMMFIKKCSHEKGNRLTFLSI